MISFRLFFFFERGRGLAKLYIIKLTHAFIKAKENINRKIFL